MQKGLQAGLDCRWATRLRGRGGNRGSRLASLGLNPDANIADAMPLGLELTQ